MQYLGNSARQAMQGVCCFIRFKQWSVFRIFSSTDMHLDRKVPNVKLFNLSFISIMNKLYLVLTFSGDEPSNGCINVPAPSFAKKRQPILSCEVRWFSPLMDASGRFGQARTPNTTFPSSSNANAMAYWPPLRNLLHNPTITLSSCQVYNMEYIIIEKL